MSLTVDDRDSSISYSPGWQQVSTTAEYDGTKSGAASAGMTATFKFSGTAVQVYGAMGSYDVYGVPVSSYTIDGGDSATYTAPLIQPPYFESRVLFYQSPSLSAGEHTLVITNQNGTKPCVFWLDYIVYFPVAITSSPATSSPAIAPTQPPQGGQTSASADTPSSPSDTPASAPTVAASPPSQQSPASSSGSSIPSSAQSLASTPATQVTNGVNTTLPANAPLVLATSGSQTFTLTGAALSPAPSNSAIVPSPSSQVAGSSASARNRGAPTGAMAGGIVGGIALIILTLIFALYRCRKFRRHGEAVSPFHAGGDYAKDLAPNDQETALRRDADWDTELKPRRDITSEASVSSAHVVAFASHENLVVPPTLRDTQERSTQEALPMSGSPTSPLPSGSTTHASHAAAEVFDDAVSQEDDDFHHSASGSLSQSTASSVPIDPRAIRSKLRQMRHAREESRAPSREPILRHHEDSGVRIPPQSAMIVDVPPEYTPN